MTREERESIKGKAINDAMNSIENRVRHVYNQGFEEGKDYYIQKYGNAYNKGLEDAWDCARKIIGLGEPIDVVGCAGLRNFICGYSASEAIARLKKYEKQTESMSKAYAEVKEWLDGHLNEDLTDNSNQVKERTEKNCRTCRYGNIPDCGIYPCNECKRDTFPKWTPKRIKEQTEKSCDNCGHRFDVSYEILDSGECCINEGKWIPKQTEKSCENCGYSYGQHKEYCNISGCCDYRKWTQKQICRTCEYDGDNYEQLGIGFYAKQAHCNCCHNFDGYTSASIWGDDKIRVGDQLEIIESPNPNEFRKCIVTKITENSSCVNVIFDDGEVGYINTNLKFYITTGKHFPELVEFIEKIKGE